MSPSTGSTTSCRTRIHRACDLLGGPEKVGTIKLANAPKRTAWLWRIRTACGAADLPVGMPAARDRRRSQVRHPRRSRRHAACGEHLAQGRLRSNRRLLCASRRVCTRPSSRSTARCWERADWPRSSRALSSPTERSASTSRHRIISRFSLARTLSSWAASPACSRLRSALRGSGRYGAPWGSSAPFRFHPGTTIGRSASIQP